MQQWVIDGDGDGALALVAARRQRLLGIDDAQPRFIVGRGHPRGPPIEQQQGQRIIDGQHPKHHAINKIEPEQKTHQPQVGVGGGGEEILDDDGALIADEPLSVSMGR